ncbi:MAG: hypothetical protein LQ342_004951 [Letrouitia transgressa]|nr:MAG: hypothetical protein LQ342_004951 [Letrouitia transgressa]
MVRIKHRYLLVNILYPEQQDREGRSTGITKNVPDLVNFHRPTPDDITPQLLIRAIKDHVSLMYGDYGIGMITSSLNGTIRKAEEEAIRRAKEMILKAKQDIQDGVSSSLDAVFGLGHGRSVETASSLVRNAESSSTENPEESDMDEGE